MTVAQVTSYIDTGLIGLLILIIGYFLRRLILKLEDGNTKLTDIDKDIAVLLTEFKSYKKIIEITQAENTRLNKELEIVRADRHKLVEHIHRIELIVMKIEERQNNAI